MTHALNLESSSLEISGMDKAQLAPKVSGYSTGATKNSSFLKARWDEELTRVSNTASSQTVEDADGVSLGNSPLDVTKGKLQNSALQSHLYSNEAFGKIVVPMETKQLSSEPSLSKLPLTSTPRLQSIPVVSVTQEGDGINDAGRRHFGILDRGTTQVQFDSSLLSAKTQRDLKDSRLETLSIKNSQETVDSRKTPFALGSLRTSSLVAPGTTSRTSRLSSATKSGTIEAVQSFVSPHAGVTSIPVKLIEFQDKHRLLQPLSEARSSQASSSKELPSQAVAPKSDDDLFKKKEGSESEEGFYGMGTARTSYERDGSNPGIHPNPRGWNVSSQRLESGQRDPLVVSQSNQAHQAANATPKESANDRSVRIIGDSVERTSKRMADSHTSDSAEKVLESDRPSERIHLPFRAKAGTESFPQSTPPSPMAVVTLHIEPQPFASVQSPSSRNDQATPSVPHELVSPRDTKVLEPASNFLQSDAPDSKTTLVPKAEFDSQLKSSNLPQTFRNESAILQSIPPSDHKVESFGKSISADTPGSLAVNSSAVGNLSALSALPGSVTSSYAQANAAADSMLPSSGTVGSLILEGSSSNRVALSGQPKLNDSSPIQAISGTRKEKTEADVFNSSIESVGKSAEHGANTQSSTQQSVSSVNSTGGHLAGRLPGDVHTLGNSELAVYPTIADAAPASSGHGPEIRSSKDLRQSPFEIMDQEVSGTHAPSALNGGASSRELVLGVHDPSLGYLEVRANLGNTGIHASVIAQSTDAQQTLESHVHQLTGWMNDRQTPLERLTISSSQNGQLGDSQTAPDRRQSSGQDAHGTESSMNTVVDPQSEKSGDLRGADLEFAVRDLSTEKTASNQSLYSYTTHNYGGISVVA